MSEHTPGPWTISGPSKPDNVGGRDWAVVDGNLLIVAEAFEVPARAVTFPAEANARLIAAAPDLLEAARKLHKQIAFDVFVDDQGHRAVMLQAFREIEMAIAKAEGRTHELRRPRRTAG